MYFAPSTEYRIHLCRSRCYRYSQNDFVSSILWFDSSIAPTISGRVCSRQLLKKGYSNWEYRDNWGHVFTSVYKRPLYVRLELVSRWYFTADCTQSDNKCLFQDGKRRNKKNKRGFKLSTRLAFEKSSHLVKKKPKPELGSQTEDTLHSCEEAPRQRRCFPSLFTMVFWR